MDFDNALSDSMVKRVISFVVAVIIVSVVAIPVVNALTDENGSDGGDSAPITYTNSGDFYYKSATADNSLHTFEYIHKEHLINEDDWEWIDSYEIDGVEVLRYSPDTSQINIPQFFIGWSETTQYWIEPGNALNYKESNGSRGDLAVEPTDLIETETSYELTLSLSIQNGTMSYVDMDTHQTQTVPIKYYLSSEEQGDYVLSETPIVAENTDIYIAKDGYAPETNHQSGTAYYTLGGKINSSELTQDTVIVQGVGYYGVATSYQEGTLYCEMNSIKGNNILTLSSMEVHGYLTLRYNDTQHTIHYFEFTDSITQFLVPTTVTVTPSNTHTVTYTNSGDYYYKSATADSNEHIIDIEYTEITGESPSFTKVLKIDGTTVLNQSVGRGVDTYYLFGWSQSQTIGLSIQDAYMFVMNNADNTLEQIFGTFIEEVTLEHGSTVHLQYVISDGVLSFTDFEDVERSYPIDYYMSGTGEYVLADTPVVSASENTPIKLWINCVAEPINAPTPLAFSIYGTIGSGNIVSDTESISLNVNAKLGDVTSNTLESTLTSSRIGDLITLDNVSCEGQIATESNTYYGSVSSTQFIVPTTVNVEEEGGGSDSNSNMTNTIIKTIPIFLVLGLLIAFALPMVQGKFE